MAEPDTEMDVAGRLARLRGTFAAAEIDAILITEQTNVRYLCGFTGSSGVLLVLADGARLITDGRYATQAPEQIGAAGASVEVDIAADDRTVVKPLVEALRLGLEAGAISWAGQQRYAAAFPDTTLQATSGLVEELRAVKDAGELTRMARAASIADATLEHVRAMLEVGLSELDIAFELDTELRRRGASGPAFETIVASGPNSAKPHGRPTDRPIASNELIITDFGAVYDGYRSDMTRMTVLGQPTDEQQKLLSVVQQAQAAGVALVRPGVTCSAIDAACRSIIVEAGFGEAFMHGTGHGVGLDIHEAPSVNAQSGATLQPGHVITVEPGVYLPGLGGVRIEDTVVVTDDGCRPLTCFPKSHVIID